MANENQIGIDELKEKVEEEPQEIEGTVEDIYGKEVAYSFHSAEADEFNNESYFYFLLEPEDETCEIEFTKEQGIELVKAMVKALGAKKMKIEIEF